MTHEITAATPQYFKFGQNVNGNRYQLIFSSTFIGIYDLESRTFVKQMAW